MPLGCEIDDVVMIGVGGSDAMDYHALEAMQCMVERRTGRAGEEGAGEQGVAAVELVEGDEVWRLLESGRISRELLEAALSRSDSPQGLTIEDGRTQDLLGSGELVRLCEKPRAYFIEYRDGLMATMLMLNGAVPRSVDTTPM